jgi:hypothetical protein
MQNVTQATTGYQQIINDVMDKIPLSIQPHNCKFSFQLKQHEQNERVNLG